MRSAVCADACPNLCAHSLNQLAAQPHRPPSLLASPSHYSQVARLPEAQQQLHYMLFGFVNTSGRGPQYTDPSEGSIGEDTNEAAPAPASADAAASVIDVQVTPAKSWRYRNELSALSLSGWLVNNRMSTMPSASASSAFRRTRHTRYIRRLLEMGFSVYSFLVRERAQGVRNVGAGLKARRVRRASHAIAPPPFICPATVHLPRRPPFAPPPFICPALRLPRRPPPQVAAVFVPVCFFDSSFETAGGVAFHVLGTRIQLHRFPFIPRDER